MKAWLSSSSVLLSGDQDSSRQAGPSRLLLDQSRSWSWSTSCFWFQLFTVPKTPLKTFSSSHDWQLSVTSLSRRTSELRGRRLRRKTLKEKWVFRHVCGFEVLWHVASYFELCFLSFWGICVSLHRKDEQNDIKKNIKVKQRNPQRAKEREPQQKTSNPTKWVKVQKVTKSNSSVKTLPQRMTTAWQK